MEKNNRKFALVRRFIGEPDKVELDKVLLNTNGENVIDVLTRFLFNKVINMSLTKNKKIEEDLLYKHIEDFALKSQQASKYLALRFVHQNNYLCN